MGAAAQFFERPVYPQNYFQWPVGAQKAIVANFGELRSNHFHMGLDCRTEQAVNKPIYAAAEGYVAKVKIEPWGFGRAIYVNHPNGYQTVYAHCNDFFPELEAYVKEQQYKQKKWEIFLDIPEGLFKVKKGQFIAYSGNTGGSMGPHLHFEIREAATDKVLNPLLFGIPITDKQAPDVLRLAVYDRTKSTYDQTPKIYPLTKVNGIYQPAGGAITAPSDKVSFAITAWDRYTGSTNQNGIFQAILFNNEKPVSGFQLNNIDYIETRYLNAHIDCKTKFNGGPWLQHLSKLPGLPQGFYKTDESNGVINLADGAARNIRIEVADANENYSNVKFTLKPGGAAKSITPFTGEKFGVSMVNIFERENIAFYLPAGMLYDSVNFSYKELPATAKGSPVYLLHNPGVPVHSYFTVKIKDNMLNMPSGKMVIKRSYGSKEDFKPAKYENGWYTAQFREFGFYQLIEDTSPPVITPIGFSNGMNASKSKSIRFKVTDDSEDLESFTATLNGEWLRFSNDKGKIFVYDFDEKCPAGENELIIEAVDMVGNKTVKTYKFTR